MQDDDTRALLRRAKAGDREALDDLLDRVRDRLTGLSKTLVGAKLRAKVRSSDVLQSSYLEVLRDVPKFDGENEEVFAAWVARIVENNVHRKVRYYAAQKRRAPGAAAEEVEEVEGRQPTPSVAVTRTEDLKLASRALQRLPDAYREVIVWRIVDEKDFEEIARLTASTVAAVRTQLWRARAALTIEVEKLEREEG